MRVLFAGDRGYIGAVLVPCLNQFPVPLCLRPRSQPGGFVGVQWLSW